MKGRWSLDFARIMPVVACALLAWLAGCQTGPEVATGTTLHIVSYDATRELFREMNSAFIDGLGGQGKNQVTIRMSHGGSGKQGRAVIDGLEADVVNLALAWDIDMLAARGLIRADWAEAWPNGSCPFTSTVVFLVRAGNPKGIADWPDLVRPDVDVLTPNPKSSGGARWNHLAAWAWAIAHFDGNEAEAREWMRALYARVPVLNAAARGSMTTLVRTGVGDVLLAWEHEARLAMEEVGPGRFEIVYPSLSIRAEPPAAIVDARVESRGTRNLAERYLTFLYSPAGQEIIARHWFRPLHDEVAHRYPDRFPPIDLVRLTDLYPDWQTAHRFHFADGGLYDQVKTETEVGGR